MRYELIMVVLALLGEHCTINAEEVAVEASPLAVANLDRPLMVKRAGRAVLPDLNLPAEEDEDFPTQLPDDPTTSPQKHISSKAKAKALQWKESSLGIVKEAAPDEDIETSFAPIKLKSLSVAEKFLLSSGAMEEAAKFPVEDIANRARAVRKLYLEHGIFLTALQIYMFFVNHLMLPELAGRPSRRIKEGTGTEVDRLYGRKRVEVLHHGLMKHFAEHPEYTRDQLLHMVVETYRQNQVAGDLRKKAAIFLNRWGYSGGQPRRESKSRSALVVEVNNMLEKYPLDDYWGRRQCVSDFYASKGIIKPKKFLREFCYRHGFVPRIRPPTGYSLKSWTQRISQHKDAYLGSIRDRLQAPDGVAPMMIQDPEETPVTPGAGPSSSSGGTDRAPTRP